MLDNETLFYTLSDNMTKQQCANQFVLFSCELGDVSSWESLA